MRLLAYKAPFWENDGAGGTRFTPAHFEPSNLLDIVVSDDDAVFDGFLQSDGTQTLEALNEDGSAFASGLGGPYFRYTMTTGSGDSFTVDLVVVGGKVVYMVPDIPPAGVSFVISNVQLVDGVTTLGLPYAELPKAHCFAPGTLIDTAKGPRPVETLRAGALVHTLDAGLQPLVWTGGARVPWDADSPHRPVTLRGHACALGEAYLPLTLSAHHRVLVGGPALDMQFGLTQAFAPAIGLADGAAGSGVQHWHHILCDRHQIVRANGLWVETMLLTARTLDWLAPADRATIRACQPAGDMVPARPCLTKSEARLLGGCAGSGSRAA